jgi:lactate permease
VAGGAVDDAGFVDRVRGQGDRRDPPGAVVRAYLPYLIIIAVFAVAQIGPVKTLLADVTQMVKWPGLQVVNTKGKPLSAGTFKLDWLASAGSLLLIAGVLTMVALRVRVGIALRAYADTLDQLKWAILTVVAVLALAYVMNFSGQTVTLGSWMAGAGGFFAFLSPILGWLGTAVTGSDTSANALFSTLQQSAAEKANLDATLLVAANTSGGVVGKMISPQNLTIAATAVGILGREGDLFRFLVRSSIGLILCLCVLVFLQSTSVLGWMLP